MLVLPSITRSDEGVYECVADNRVGDRPVRAQIVLNVLCKWIPAACALFFFSTHFLFSSCPLF